MSTQPVFGNRKSNANYVPRAAAYVVILRDRDHFASVRSNDRHFLPGGGCLLGELPEQTAVREVREELAHEIAIGSFIGNAIQYFHSVADRVYYEMEASFFRAALGGTISATPEHQLVWLPTLDVEHLLFHASHAWPIRRALSGSVTNAA